MKQVGLIKAKTFELDPNKRYVMVVSDREMTKKDAYKANEQLTVLGVKSFTIMVGNPDTVKIIDLG